MIKLVNIIKPFITENRKYEYGCVMLYFDFSEIDSIHNNISVEDLYEDENDDSFGLEKEPHTTLLFGLHPVSLMDIKNTLKPFTFGVCKIHNVSAFKNEKYDVLKFDVIGKNLHKANEALKQFPYTSNFPNYHPHLTIAYLKPGTSDKYIEMFKDKEYKLIPNKIVYSLPPNGDKKIIPIKVDL